MWDTDSGEGCACVGAGGGWEISVLSDQFFFEPTTALKNGLLREFPRVVQWLGFRAFTAKGTGSIPGWGTKIPQAAGCSKRKNKQTTTT